MTPFQNLIGRRYMPLKQATGERIRAQQPDAVITAMPGFLTDDGVTRFRNEARDLLRHGQRRDLRLYGTPRKLVTVNHATIAAIGRLIPGFLSSPELLEFLSGVAGTELVVYGDFNESAVLLHLDQVGDTHGSHSDEFRYAFGVALEVPGKFEKGGVLEFAPGQTDPRALNTKTCIHHRMEPGDAYLMHRTDENVHRVSPLQLASSRRTMLSLALTTPEERDAPSRSSEQMFGEEKL